MTTAVGNQNVVFFTQYSRHKNVIDPQEFSFVACRVNPCRTIGCHQVSSSGAKVWIVFVGIKIFIDVPSRSSISYRLITSHIFTRKCFFRVHKLWQKDFNNLENIRIQIVVRFQNEFGISTECSRPFVSANDFDYSTETFVNRSVFTPSNVCKLGFRMNLQSCP